MARNRFIHIVNRAQHAVAVGFLRDNHPEGQQVKDFINHLMLDKHLPVDGIDMLHPSQNAVRYAQFAQAAVNLRPRLLDHDFVPGAVLFRFGHDLLIANRVQIFQRQVLQFPFEALHSQPVGHRRVKLHGFQRLAPLCGGGLIVHRAHVVEAVGDFDQNHAHVFVGGEKHFSEILHLLFFLVHLILKAGQFADAFHQVRHGGGEQARQVRVRDRGILNHVVEQGGLDGFRVQPQFLRENLRHGQRMDDVRFSALALLPVVSHVREGERVMDPGKVRGGIVAPHGIFQFFILFLHGHATHPL